MNGHADFCCGLTHYKLRPLPGRACGKWNKIGAVVEVNENTSIASVASTKRIRSLSNRLNEQGDRVGLETKGEQRRDRHYAT